MNTTTTPAPLQLGQSRSFAAGPIHLLTVSRTTAGYVVTATRDGHDLPCYTSVFAPDNVPADMTPRVAAFVYMAGLHNEFTAETPAAPVAAEPTPLSEDEYRILLAAHSNGGQIRPAAGCTPTLLRNLAARGLVALETTSTGRVRRGLVTADGAEYVRREYAARRTNHRLAA